jgi:uncharacterized Tic20 family protein
MTTETPVASSDDRLLSAIAHMFGILVALIVWATHKDKSPFVRYQAAQAIAFDVVVMVFSMVFSVCLFGVMFCGMFASILTLAAAETSGDPGWPILILPGMFPFLFLVLVPVSLVFVLARLIAAVSVLNGNEFRYPWLGKQVEKFLAS